ncbi:hypothetical protein GJ496_009841 [Pomphorhynchus laevis]|nr:hypothetical protein GJ496_009841 [Pomphorhynchus laevis]
MNLISELKGSPGRLRESAIIKDMRRSLAPSRRLSIEEFSCSDHQKSLNKGCNDPTPPLQRGFGTNKIQTENNILNNGEIKILDVNRMLPTFGNTTHEQFISSVLSKPFKFPFQNGSVQCELSSRNLGMRRSVGKLPLHDPFAENALILYEPDNISKSDSLKLNQDEVKVHVVVDPLLANYLRPHQREGVKFMYDCATGVRIANSYGCIMADEMGLGKTLQCVTLIWTMLKQSPDAKPTTTKAMIVAPSSLVKNWANEINKWLGNRLGLMAIESGSKQDIDNKLISFTAQQNKRVVQPVLIISYETFRSHSDLLVNDTSIDLVICDEGHRLKNLENQTYASLSALSTRRRILLSGTPIQNDLLEYFSLVHFVNSGILGTVAEFRKKYEIPILRSRESHASSDERAKGQSMLDELISIVNRCLIRRTQSLLSRYLPQKSVFVVCCRLTMCQIQCYELIVAKITKMLDILDKSSKPTVLAFITLLRNLCNHPYLLKDKEPQVVNGKSTAINNNLKGLEIPKVFDPSLSGKMLVLDRLLAVIKSTTNDKVVLISNFTQTLSLFETLCKSRGYKYVRLDGSLSMRKRSKLVDDFNSLTSDLFIFMLSSKAGGCGLNLIGANRLVMFDPDWNPANDDQAMARIWRDGQRKPCLIYRLVTTGTLEEKIIQRQAHKKALSSCVVDEEGDVERHFSTDQLRDLFKLKLETVSDTHDTLKCRRCVNNVQVRIPSVDEITATKEGGCVEPNDLSRWSHCFDRKHITDVVLKQVWCTKTISFAFAFSTHLGVNS